MSHYLLPNNLPLIFSKEKGNAAPNSLYAVIKPHRALAPSAVNTAPPPNTTTVLPIHIPMVAPMTFTLLLQLRNPPITSRLRRLGAANTPPPPSTLGKRKNGYVDLIPLPSAKKQATVAPTPSSKTYQFTRCCIRTKITRIQETSMTDS